MKPYMQPIFSITEAYRAIHEFFSCYDLRDALSEVDLLYTWACKEKYYNKTAPADIIFCAQQLHYLFTAAEIIYYSAGKKASALLYFSVPGRPLHAHHSSIHAPEPQQNFFPSHLTPAEYMNPYLAFEKLAASRHWAEVLQELMEASLSNGSIEGQYPIGKVMKWRDRMVKIIEGGWLINSRIKLFNEHPIHER